MLATFLPSPSRGEGRQIAVLALFFFLALTLPAFAADLAGDWYGEGYQPLWREEAQWIMHLAPDGGYAIHFRRYRDCKLVVDQKERGTWKLDDRFRTVTTDIDGAPTRFENDYRLDAASDREFKITHDRTGQDYTETRVAPDFKFPTPDCVTS